MKKLRRAEVFVAPEAERYEEFMREALGLGQAASAANEVPVGAVVVRDGVVIGRGQDRRVELCDPTAHAEVLAIRDAARAIGDWRLDDCALFVTLEPCAMCAGAILLARIPLVVYGAGNPKFGATGSVVDIFSVPGWNHKVEAVSGVLADEGAGLMREWFAGNRRG